MFSRPTAGWTGSPFGRRCTRPVIHEAPAISGELSDRNLTSRACLLLVWGDFRNSSRSAGNPALPRPKNLHKNAQRRHAAIGRLVGTIAYRAGVP